MAKELSMSKLDTLLTECVSAETVFLSHTVGGEEICIAVRRTVDLKTFTEIVLAIVQNLFVEGDDGAEMYLPEKRALATAANILAYYTNLKNDIGAQRMVKLVYGSDLYQKIVSSISPQQLCDIERAVDERVAFIQKSIFSEREHQLQKVIASIDSATQAFQSFSEPFSTFGEEKMRRVLDNLASMDASQLLAASSSAQ